MIIILKFMGNYLEFVFSGKSATLFEVLSVVGCEKSQKLGRNHLTSVFVNTSWRMPPLSGYWRVFFWIIAVKNFGSCQ